MRSMIVAFAVPPPSQIARRPYLPCLRSNSCTNVVMSLVPVAPRGCPRAIAPPFTLNLSMLPPANVLATASGTGAKASFTSTKSMSFISNPARFRAAAVAGTGPSSMMTGSAPTTASETTLACGVKPNFLRPFSLQTRTAEAPSQIWEDVAAVMMPFGNIGFIFANASSDVDLIPSSLVCISTGLSPFDNFTGNGTISLSKRPALVASAARAWLVTAN
mmetsp:Transcript_6548/g.18381  ORF Transcript_6548/g.18381 Transcript_6548/m.18381 type:complete len:218 (+) Transcript_6548:296-949(+)